MPDRLALIIANNEFDDPKISRLKTPGRDAEALADVLCDPVIGGFEVTLLVDETERIVRRAIARLYQRRKRRDLLLLYYSGHGIRDDYGELYLAVKDTESDVVSATAIDAAFVRGQLDRSGAQRKVVVLDCCHSGLLPRGAKAALGTSVGAQEALAGSGYGRVILTASNAVEYAWEGNKLLGEAETSVFTRSLVQGLRTGAADLNGDGQISLDEWYDYVYEQVVTEEQCKQTPQKWAQKVEGQIIIARNPQPVVRPSELPPDLLQAVESPFTEVRKGAVRELERLSRGNDEGLAKAAREALARLAEDDSKQVSAAAAHAISISAETASVGQVPVTPPPGMPKKPESMPPASIVCPACGASARSQAHFCSRCGEPLAAGQPPTPAPRRESLSQTAPDVLTITSPIHLELVRVPAGGFLMGSDPAKDKLSCPDEQPQHRVYVAEFYIGKYPVTEIQYATFMAATGHSAPHGWKEENKTPSNARNYAVVDVSWYDAVAFCEWLSQETDRAFRLPTEAEWEKAARGNDARIYPWGNDPPTNELCNFNDSMMWTEAGSFSPQGDSPYGCADMAGGVWEWTQSIHRAYPYDSADGRENLEAEGRRVQRGGCAGDPLEYVRCALRNYENPDHRGYGYGTGFRLVTVPVDSNR
jgi:formylglycine-generating enzyme required for sulfatase activity